MLAATKYIYEERGTGGEARIKMWVTSTHHEGPLLICDGWMLRFPAYANVPFKQGTFTHPVSGGIVISGGTLPGGVMPPVVEEHASTPCSERCAHAVRTLARIVAVTLPIPT